MRSVTTAFLLVVLCAILALAEARTATAGDLFDFRSDSGRFRIGFPGKAPASRNLYAAKFDATTNNVLHQVRIGESEFAVELHDIPHAAALLLPQSFILERAKKGMLADIGARELTSREVGRQQHAARRVRYEVLDEDREGELLLVLAKRRLYLVTARYPKRNEPPEALSPFLDSFEFWLD